MTVTIDLANLAVNDGPKAYSRLANIGEFVEVRNFDSGGCMIDVRIDDTEGGNMYLGTITRIHGHVEGLAEGAEVRFPMDRTFRCRDSSGAWL